ncbi:short-chain dehydrogenase [Peniophora sp. CONT]|nr:short-chain dehydrogenase [Peniophora sp. CONT]
MAVFSTLRFLADQWRTVPKLEKQDLSGETVLVVGANIGLGLEAAKHFASMGPGKLILACRSLKKAEDAAKEIKKATGFDRTTAYAVDLSIFSSVNSFVDDFAKNEERLDVLLFNAGVAHTRYQSTKDGFEESIQVNDLSCALVCIGLLPLMLKTSEDTASASHRPRITVVSSGTHFWTKPLPEELSSPNYLLKLSDADHCTPKIMADRYQVSKLVQILFARELAERVGVSRVIVDSVSPGFCRSTLGRNMGILQSIQMKIMYAVLAQSTEVGGRQIAWAALAHRNCEHVIHGRYTQYMEAVEESDWALSEEGFAMQTRLWDETTNILKGVSPKFNQIVDQYLQ